jgi:hypothetical protein
MKHMKTSEHAKTLRFTGLGLAVLLLASAFNNCSKVKVSEAPAAALGSTAVTATGAPAVGTTNATTPVGSAQLIASCAEARNAGRISVQKVEVTFEDPGVQCAWGANGNLSQLDGYVRARMEQQKVVQVDKNAKICNILMTNADIQNFRYDDNIILTLNQFVLASTTNFGSHFSNVSGFQKYDWSKLVNQAAQNGKNDSTPDKQYCAGATQGLSSCLFPVTETLGKVDLNFDQRVIQNIMGMTNPTEATLGFITTGDNDSATDCRHVPIRLLLDIEYFL